VALWLVLKPKTENVSKDKGKDKGNGKGKFLTRTGHEGPEGE